MKKIYRVFANSNEMRAVSQAYKSSDFEEHYDDWDYTTPTWEQTFDNYNDAMREYNQTDPDTPYRMRANFGEVIFYEAVTVEEQTLDDDGELVDCRSIALKFSPTERVSIEDVEFDVVEVKCDESGDEAYQYRVDYEYDYGAGLEAIYQDYFIERPDDTMCYNALLKAVKNDVISTVKLCD